MFWTFLLLCLCSSLQFALSDNCKHKYFGSDSTVCVCNLFHCDFISEIETPINANYVTYTTSKAGNRFTKINGVLSQNSSQNYDALVQINPMKTYQTILGFGGAFTDSTGINIDNLLFKSMRDNIIKSYFGADGIGYTFSRVPIGCTDFSTHSYTYDDKVGDINLTDFKLASEDYKYKIPFIKQAMTLSNNTLKLLGSAWTPPKWMKTNNQLSGISFLLDNMYQPWANYYLKYLQAYEQEGINYWGLTTGNEPTVSIFAGNLKLPSLTWTFDGQQKWINENFGPTIKSHYPNIKLLAWDDQRYLLPFYIDQLLNDTTTRNFIDGVAVHWYFDTDFPASALTETHNSNPEKFILATEASIMSKPKLGNWTNAEKYAEDIIEDLQNWATGWIDWNMVLNREGGPTYIGNYLDSPIIVDRFRQEFYKQPMYYILGHFSKFLEPGSIRIEANYNAALINSVAFKRTDGTIAVILFNKQDKNSTIVIEDGAKGYMTVNVPKRSIVTVLY